MEILIGFNRKKMFNPEVLDKQISRVMEFLKSRYNLKGDCEVHINFKNKRFDSKKCTVTFILSLDLKFSIDRQCAN